MMKERKKRETKGGNIEIFVITEHVSLHPFPPQIPPRLVNSCAKKYLNAAMSIFSKNVTYLKNVCSNSNLEKLNPKKAKN